MRIGIPVKQNIAQCSGRFEQLLPATGILSLAVPMEARQQAFRKLLVQGLAVE